MAMAPHWPWLTTPSSSSKERDVLSHRADRIFAGQNASLPYPLPVWGGGHQLCNEHEGSGGDRICGTPVVGVVVLEFIKLRRQVADNLPPYKPGVLVLLTLGSILKVIDINVFEWAHILVLLLSTSLWTDPPHPPSIHDVRSVWNLKGFWNGREAVIVQSINHRPHSKSAIGGRWT